MNFLRRYSSCLVPFSFLLTVGVSLLGWTLHPEKSGWFILPAGYFLMLLVDVVNSGWAHPERERAFSETQFALRMFQAATALVATSCILVLLAVGADLLDQSWSLSARRTVWMLTSGSLIVFGNLLPKLPSPWRHAEEPFDWQGVHRFAGAVFILAGVVSFVGWTLMPFADARNLSRAAFVVMAVLVVGRKWYSLLTWPDKRRTVQS